MKELIERPRLAAPALRALAGAGIHYLNDLAKFRETDIARLHGIGPNALLALNQAMQEHGIHFSA